MKKILLGIIIGVVGCLGIFVVYDKTIKLDDESKNSKKEEVDNNNDLNNDKNQEVEETNLLCKSSLNNGEFVYKVKKDGDIVTWSIEKDNNVIIKRTGNYNEIDNNDSALLGINTKDCGISSLTKTYITDDSNYNYYYIDATLFGTYTGFGGIVTLNKSTNRYNELFELYIDSLIEYKLKDGSVTVANARVENGKVYNIIRHDNGLIMEYEYTFANGNYTRKTTKNEYMPVSGIK